MKHEARLALILSAAAFAAHKHTFQRRKDADASPYINHPLELARILCEEGGVDAPEVTDTKWLDKGSRKRLQISKAAKFSEAAKLVKLADKIANLRDIIASSPAGWSLQRKREYFDWAKQVVDNVRGVSVKLERRFDSLYRQKP